MKNVYAITVREVLERTVCVEAEDLDEAIDKVESAYYDVQIILEPEDLSDRDFVPSCYAGENGIVDESELDDYKENYQWI
jgi:hypothetical protein